MRNVDGMHLFRRLATFALLALSVACAHAADLYKAGDTLVPFTVKDQHEQEFTFAPGPRTVIVSFSMGVGKDANGYFAKQPADFLAKNQTLFIANIYGMPAIGRFFALPKMKKYPHRILLGDDEHLLDRFPTQEGKLTVLRLDPSAKITAVEFVDAEKELPAIFAAK
jgi:hypothetical protein